MNASGASACRLPSGHPEAFFEAFANVYRAAFDAMVDAFGDFIEIHRNSRLVARNQRFLQCLLGFTEVPLPLHLRVCLSRPEVKSFAILTVYKLEK